MTQETLGSLPVSERNREVPVCVRMQAEGFVHQGCLLEDSRHWYLDAVQDLSGKPSR